MSTSATETRKDAASVLGAASAAARPSKTGVGQKLAIATTVYRLARRYPMAALVVGGIGLAYYMSRRRVH